MGGTSTVLPLATVYRTGSALDRLTKGFVCIERRCSGISLHDSTSILEYCDQMHSYGPDYVRYQWNLAGMGDCLAQ